MIDIGLNLKLNIHALATIMDEIAKEFDREDDMTSNVTTGEGVLRQFHEAKQYPTPVFFLVSERIGNGMVDHRVEVMHFDQNGDHVTDPEE